MREEEVTKIILNWLESNSWQIVCYDFPQSGTGILLHPNGSKRREKNKGGIIPDIIAVKNNTALFFENKDRFYKPDFDKLLEIKTRSNYSDALNDLLADFNIETIFYGIGIPNSKNEIDKSKKYLDNIDFLVSCNEQQEIQIISNPNNIFMDSST